MERSQFAEWLQACESEGACGPALDYDSQFLTLEMLLQGKPEQQYGDTIIPAEKPDWRAVRSVSTELLKRSKDLRVAVSLTRALTVIEGVPGFAKGVGVVAELLQDYWDSVHPRIEQDGETDPLIRANALSALSDTPTLLAELRECTFVSASGVSITVRDAETALSPADAIAPVMTRDQLQAMLVNSLPNSSASLNAVEFAYSQVESITEICALRMGQQERPDLTALTRTLKLLSTAIVAARSVSVGANENTVVANATDDVVTTRTPSGSFGKLASRAEAIRALDAALEYFEQNEPSSPVPIFLNRAKKLTGMRFMDIIREVSPESMNTIEVIAGTSNQS